MIQTMTKLMIRTPDLTVFRGLNSVLGMDLIMGEVYLLLQECISDDG